MHFFVTENLFFSASQSTRKLAFSEVVSLIPGLSFNVMPLSMICFSDFLNVYPAIAWNNFDFILATSSSWYFVLYSNSVYMYFAMFTRGDKFALPNHLAVILFLVHTRLHFAFFAECCLRYFIKRAGKTPVLERPINASNEKRSELRFCSKSMFSNKIYV